MKNSIAYAALVVLGVALGLAVGEISARVLWRDPPPAPEKSEPPPNLPPINGALGLMRKNTEGIHKGVYYRTNSAGFRGREYSKLPAPEVFRIAIAGDSFTMGQGVLEEQAYPHLLEQRLNVDAGGTRYEVLNLGIGGLNIDRVGERLERVGLRFQPDLIVYGCTWNDIRNEFYRESMGKHPLEEQFEVYQRYADSPSYLLRTFWPRWKSFEELLFAKPGTMVFEVLDNYFDNPAAWQTFERGLDRFATIQQKRDVPVVVFVHTSLAYLTVFHPFRKVYAAIEGAAEQRGLGTIQSFEAFRGRSPESLWLSAFDSHPNAVGHQLLAEALYEGLRPYLPEAQPERVPPPK